MNVSDTASIQDSLAASAVRLSSIHSRDLLQDKARNDALKHALAGCHFDFSRQRVDQQALAELATSRGTIRAALFLTPLQ